MSEAGPAFLAGGGEMGALMRAHDWARTPLGAIEDWSPSLRMMVSFLLVNRFPLLLWWGSDYVSIYNDAYRPVLGTKHPAALGLPGRECWSEIWDILQPLIDKPFGGGPATWMDDLALEINRYGYFEETHFTVAYSPVPDETASNGIGGVLATVHETTEKVIGERRVLALRDLGLRMAGAKTAEAACVLACEILSEYAKDVPFALVYLIEPDRKTAKLAGWSGVPAGLAISPLVISLADGESGWELGDAAAERDLQFEDLGRRFPEVPAGPFADPPQSALVVPIRSSRANEPAGVLIAGISARLRLNELYRSFLGLVAAQIATAVANARAYEEERRRAEALAELDRAKTTFFSNVSHEFRTPLTLMLSPIEEMRGRIESGTEHAALLDVAHRNALRLLKLVNSLLDFSRIEAGRVEAKYQPTDIGGFTAELASSFRSAIESAGLKLVINVRELPEQILVDREMWEKVVLNLLSNAFKFTFEGEIEVAVGMSVSGGAELVVRDTGIGIAEEELPHLFERFHRVPGARGRTIEGSGIGLALVQELVRLHGGTVRVESAAGEGSRFRVVVPLGCGHLPADRIDTAPGVGKGAPIADAFVEEALRWLPDQRSAAAAEGAGAVRTETGGRVLVADDNADMRGYLARLLTSAGFDVETVTDGQAALEALRSSPPDLLLADVMMPRLDGLGLLAEVRSHFRLRELPVVLLSARAGEEARVEGLRAGADDYLVKPFNARELIARVEGNIRLAMVRRKTDEKTAAETRILERIARAAPLDEVLDDIARFVEKQEKGAVCSIFVVSRDGKHFSRARGPSIAHDYHAAIEGLSIEPPFSGCCGRAVKECRAVAVSDVANDQAYAAGWRDLLLQHGLRSARSTPVCAADGRVIASVGLYYRDARDPSPHDPELLDIASHLASIAIERSLTEDDLRQSNERLRRAQQAGQIANWTWDVASDAIFSVEETENVYGLADSEMPKTATTFFGRIPGRARRELAADLRSLLAGDVSRYEGEFPFRDGGGRIRWLAAKAEVVERDRTGRAARIVGVNYDVTARRAVEQKLRDNEERLRLILDSAREYAILTADLEGRITSWNKGAQRILGYEEGEIVGRDLALLFSPEDREAGVPEGEIRSAVATGSASNERWLVRRDGSRFFASGFTVPLADSHRRGVLTIFRDRTEQRGLELEIERRNAELGELTALLQERVADAMADRKVFADMVEGTDALVQVLDRDYRVLAINRACADEYERICGIRPEQGESVLEVLADQPEQLLELKAVWDRALSGEEFTEIAAIGGPEHRRHFEMKFNALRDQEGRQIGAYQFVYDVTQRVQDQASLAETQSRLFEMQKLETIGQLTGGIAHDFNNLLTPIYGTLEILQRRYAQDERSVRLISGALQSTERARVLVGRLLSFARRQHLEARPVAVAELVRGMAELIDRSLGPLIDVRLEMPASLPSARVDPNQLELALLNLCVNARDAMPGGGTLRIVAEETGVDRRMQAGLAPGRYIKLSVIDTGTGMDAETLRRAIEPFYTTKGVGRGTGLGLSMVHGLAAQSGGALTVESSPGRGTRAIVYLPVAEAESPASSGDVPDAAVEVRKLVILLVDDEELVRMGMTDILEGMGHRVIAAGSGAEALQKVRSEPDIELLVSDYMMPGMTGVALVREVRRIRPGLPALLVTGYANLDAAGAENLPRISKPFRQNELARMIAAAIGEQKVVPLRPAGVSKPRDYGGETA